MNMNKTITSLSLAAMISAFGFSSHVTAEEKTEIQWLPMSQVAIQVESTGFTDIRSINRGHKGYRVQAINSEGQATNLILNGATGEVIKQFEVSKEKEMHKMHSKMHHKTHHKMHNAEGKKEHMKNKEHRRNKRQQSNKEAS